jgi:hypothetical protein
MATVQTEFRADRRYAARSELEAIHARIDALLEAVSIIAEDQYRAPGLPENRLNAALYSATRRRTLRDSPHR